MKNLFRPAVVFFLLLQVTVLALALNPEARQEALRFSDDPKLYILRFIDRSAWRDTFSEHLPGLFPLSFACELNSDGKKQTFLSGDKIMASAESRLECSDELKIFLQSGTVLRLHRGPGKTKALELISGSIMVFSGKNESIFYYTEWGTFEAKNLKIGEFVKLKDKIGYALHLLYGNSELNLKITQPIENRLEDLLIINSSGGIATVKLVGGDPVIVSGGTYVLTATEIMPFTEAQFGKIPQRHSFPDIRIDAVILHGMQPVSGAVVGNDFVQTIDFFWFFDGAETSSCTFILSADRAHQQIILKQETTQRNIRVQGIKAGEYFFTVYCNGSLGPVYSQQIKFLVLESLMGAKPNNDEYVRNGAGEFSWDLYLGASSYEVQFSRDKGFSNFSRVSTQSNALRISLPKGSYFWRVFALGKERQPITKPTVPRKISF